MADLVHFGIVITFFWLLHRLIEAIRNRRRSRQDGVLSRLGFDPDRHELEVYLRDGSRVTGLPDARMSGDLSDGVILIEPGEGTRAGKPDSIITFIPAHSVVGIALRERAQH